MTDAELLDRLVGISPTIAQIRRRIEKVARSPVPVLIVGETGTGKEVCAEIIATLSKQSPFQPVNCAALAESLVDSELFGHERGAFTGAVRDHTGVIADANGGVLFLDELAEVPLSVQAKLLRTLESGEYRPVGSRTTRRSAFRTIAATNESPELLIAAGRLRPDLLHRVGAVRLQLPPLRDRREDIPALIDHLASRCQERSAPPNGAFAPDALHLMMSLPWPGNVRQLRNVVEASMTIAGSGQNVRECHVAEVLDLPAGGVAASAGRRRTLAQARRWGEQLAIRDALAVSSGNREAAAKILGISEATLYRRLAESAPERNGDVEPRH